MVTIRLDLDGDGVWPDLAANPEKIVHLSNNYVLEIATLDKGTTGGKPSVCFRINLPDGRVVLAETTARLFCTAAKSIMAKWPDLFDD